MDGYDLKLLIMSHYEDRHLDFVLKHWQPGRFDTQKAIVRFRKETGQVVCRPRFGWYHAVAAVAAVLVIGLFILHQQTGWTDLTAGNNAVSYALPDGTEVNLAPCSSLSYREKDFAKGIRNVKMDGKVFFDVTLDPAAPFEVSADGAFVRVLGTEFQVAAGGKDVEVYVQSGKVLFARSERADGVVLTERMGARLMDGAGVPQVEMQADVNAVAWNRGTFIFDHTPLKDVLDELGAYYGVSFAATGLDRKLSGEFSVEDLDLIVELIESALDVTIIRKK